MLLSFKGLNLGKNSPITSATTKTASRTQSTKKVIDDTLQVAKKMKDLFSNYLWEVVVTEEQLVKWLEGRTEIGIDTETTGLDVFKDKLVGISLGDEVSSIYIPVAHSAGENYKDDLSRLSELLASKSLLGFNAKFDLKFLKRHLGIDLKVDWCGYLGARVLCSSEPTNELKALYVKYVDSNAKFYSFKELFAMPFSSYDPQLVGGYAAVDAVKHLLLARKQKEVLDTKEMKLLEDLEIPLLHVLVDIELTGIAIDERYVNELSATLQSKLDAIKGDIEKDYSGLNPGSPVQVAQWLYDKLGLPQTQGRSTSEAVLSEMRHPLPSKILEYRQVQKQLSTYTTKLLKEAYEGVVHCVFNQCGADTGRFSSSSPNLQNIPRDDKFRKMFIARPGCTLVSADYTQQEVYILASLARDESMIEAYKKGVDFYAYMASIVFECPYEDCIKGGSRAELRNQMKSIVLGLNYDMGIKSLAYAIGKTVEETQSIYAKFYEKCPSIKSFRSDSLKFAKQHGYVETILGRKRYFSVLNKPAFQSSNAEVQDLANKLTSPVAIDKLKSDCKKEGIDLVDNRERQAYEVRQVVNSMVQGSAADMTKLALLVASRDSKLKELRCKILLLIHDEIIAEFPDQYAEEGGKYLANLMKDVGTDLIDIPMQCEPQLMKAWVKG